jgi:hypothetical protein
LLFVGWDDDRTAPHDNQRRKYAEVKYIEYAKDIVYVAEGEYGKYVKGGCIH